MIINDKIRKMSDVEKMHYFLKKIVDNGIDSNITKECIKNISELAKGIPTKDFLSAFELTGQIDLESDPPKVIIDVPDTTKQLTMDIVATSKKDFKDAHPIEKLPISSYLPEDELKELEHPHE